MRALHASCVTKRIKREYPALFRLALEEKRKSKVRETRFKVIEKKGGGKERQRKKERICAFR